MTIKIEHGKYYKTRSGEVVGPAQPSKYESKAFPWDIPHYIQGQPHFYAYTDDGKSCIDAVEDDIVFFSGHPI